ncbi:diphthamide biosynthesis enzyme Dph2 [Candidatus Micrarchaeota archaeon]|nr:diphthamide biosynthesis enzyme Dph2 [Candidatus Micrarchaeota archaeon]
MRILLQFPEGLKKDALAKALELENEGHEVFLSSSACYGACDLPLEEANSLRIDKLIHFGHAQFIRRELPFEVEYVEFHIKVDVGKLSGALPSLMGKKKIALVTTIQHVPQLGEMKEFLEGHGKEVLIGTGKLACYPGQVLGCDSGAALSVASGADAILYVGDGKFHPTGIRSELPVFALNPYSGECVQLNLEIEKIGKRRRGAMLRALECERFAILLSTKPGQFALNLAQEAKRKLEGEGLTAQILVSNEFNPLSIANFREFECIINTACVRLAEDAEMFGGPILNASDLDEFLELRRATNKD